MKKLKRVLIGVVALIVFLLVAAFAVDKIAFSSFYKAASKEMPIPGLWTGFVPQGFDYLENEDKFLMTGHDKDGKSPSMIYIVDGKDYKSATKVELFKENGENHNGHVGGLTHYGKYVYVTHGKSFSLFLLTDVLDGDGKATQVGKVDLVISAAYCYVQDGYLYTGEYYYPEKYETPLENRLTTPAGDNNMALMAKYELDETTSLPASEKPIALFSTVGMIQGMCFTESGKIVFSTSWGLSASQLYVYDLSNATQTTFTFNGESFPLTYLDSACLQEVVTAPPMSEELVYKDGRVFIFNESASMKYIFGKFTDALVVYSYPID